MATRTPAKKASPAKKATAKKAAAPRKAAPPAPPPARRVAASALEGHAADVWGVGLIAVGIVAGLGIYADLAGVAGRGLATAAGAAVGLGKVLVPIALVAAGAVLFRREDEEHRASDRGPRLVVGSALVGVAATGLMHLARGAPGWDEPLRAFTRAGGYVGAASGTPLRTLLGTIGAVPVLVALALVGVVVLTHTPVRAAADKVRPLQSAVRKRWSALFRIGGAASPDAPSVALFDQDKDGPAPAPKRSRSKDRARAGAAPPPGG